MLAVAFNGLARQRVRGSIVPDEDLTKFIENLRGLALALEALQNARPGAFFDAETLRGMVIKARTKTSRSRTTEQTGRVCRRHACFRALSLRTMALPDERSNTAAP